MPRFFSRLHVKSTPGEANQEVSTTTAPRSCKGKKRALSWRSLLPFRSRKKHATATTDEANTSTSAPTTISHGTTLPHSPQPTSPTVEPPQISQTETDSPPSLTTHGAVGVGSTLGSYGGTALNVLRLVLQALSAATRNVPVPGINLPFDALLTAFDKITTANQNHQGFRNLTIQLQNLHSILLEINQARNPPMDLLKSLQKELDKLRGDIQKALSSNKVEQFINSTDDASSLTAHDNTLRAIVDTLTLSVSVRTGRKVDDVHDGMEGIRGGVDRIETVLSRSEEKMVGPGLTQSFRGAKISTVRVGVDPGGHIGSGNQDILSQDFSDVHFLTGGGAVGSNNRGVGRLIA